VSNESYSCASFFTGRRIAHARPARLAGESAPRRKLLDRADIDRLHWLLAFRTAWRRIIFVRHSRAAESPSLFWGPRELIPPRVDRSFALTKYLNCAERVPVNRPITPFSRAKHSSRKVREMSLALKAFAKSGPETDGRPHVRNVRRRKCCPHHQDR
jgi:hypothetical protein